MLTDVLFVMLPVSVHSYKVKQKFVRYVDFLFILLVDDYAEIHKMFVIGVRKLQ